MHNSLVPPAPHRLPQVVPEEYARDALARVTALGSSPAPVFKTYPGMGHTATAGSLRDAAEWLTKRLPRVAAGEGTK